MIFSDKEINDLTTCLKVYSNNESWVLSEIILKLYLRVLKARLDGEDEVLMKEINWIFPDIKERE